MKDSKHGHYKIGANAYIKKWQKEHPEAVKRHKKRVHINCMHIMHNLKSNGCAICGYNKCLDALEFHHVNPEDKLFMVNSGQVHRSTKSLVNEVNKCILLCNRCHTEIHAKERDDNK